MASLYRRDRSRYWWIEYIDAAGERRQRSTKLRRDVNGETRKARALCNELTTRELSARGPQNGAEVWQAWVPRFIYQRYAGSALTLARCSIAWRNIDAFLREKQIAVPRQLTRQHARDFVEWRQKPTVETNAAAKNTALLEIKFLGAIMQEAMESGFCSSNPCLKLGIRRTEPRKKPAIKIGEHRLITREIKREAGWMRIAYKIAYWQGCRFSETRVPLDMIDLERNIFATRTKGEKSSIAEFPLSPKLRPLVRRLKAEGRAMTFDLPPKCAPAKEFWKFFQRIRLKHLCFHCTRVTFVTRCYERGIPREDVMRLAGHTTSAAHEIYPRLNASSQHLQELARRAAN